MNTDDLERRLRDQSRAAPFPRARGELLDDIARRIDEPGRAPLRFPAERRHTAWPTLAVAAALALAVAGVGWWQVEPRDGSDPTAEPTALADRGDPAPGPTRVTWDIPRVDPWSAFQDDPLHAEAAAIESDVQRTGEFLLGCLPSAPPFRPPMP